jgi:hypothetical protein
LKSLIDVNDTEAVDAEVAFIFEEHHVHNRFPAVENVAVANAEVDDR